MPSSPSTSLRLEKQATGENLNSWGTRLNTVIDLVEEAVAGVLTKALTGNVTLTSTNYVSDEARHAVLVFTDGGLSGAPTVTIPAVEKRYLVHNKGATYAITFTAGGTTASVRPGLVSALYCDGTNVFVDDPSLDKVKAPAADVSLNGKKITSLATPSTASDAATKGYVDTFASNRAAAGFKLTGLGAGASGSQDAANVVQVEALIASATVNMPAQTGNAGKYLTTDGTAPSWASVPDPLATLLPKLAYYGATL